MIQAVPELEKMREEWYHTKEIAFELIKVMKYRESVFLAVNRRITHRCLKINAVRFLYKNFDRYGFFHPDYMYNIYSSVATVPSMPMTSFKWEEKKEEQKEFNRKFPEWITAYDFLIDIDNENIEFAYSSANKIDKIFRERNIPFGKIFSGKKGFHFVIPYENLPAKLKELEFADLVELFKLFAIEFKRSMKIPDIDVGIYDLRRISKTPYSVVYPYYYVALPLTDEQFDNFSLKEVFLPNLLGKVETFRDRGLLVRDGNPNNFLELIYNVAETNKNNAKLSKIMRFDKTYLIDKIKEVGL